MRTSSATPSTTDFAPLPEEFWVGPWRVEPLANQLSLGDRVERIEPKVMQVLVCMAERPGKTISKDAFMERVWADTVVTDDVLARCISELRKVLGDKPRKPRFIETIRKAGYRLIAPVETTAPVAPDPAPAFPPPPARPAIPRPRFVPALWSPVGRSDRTGTLAVAAATVVALMLVVLPWLFYDAAPQPLKTVPFTSFPGEEYDPALSPDGQTIAFIWTGGSETVDLYVKQAESETPLQLTASEARESSPTWSPDGSEIAFVRCEDGGCGVYIVPVLGGSERRLSWFEAKTIGRLTWAPDGSALALSARTAPHEAAALYRLSLETLDEVQLTHPAPYHRGDLDLAFSPDGSQIAFIRSVVDGIQDVYTVPAKGGTPRRLTFDQGQIEGLDWTPDGRSLVFAATRDGASSLWRVAASGGAPVWLATAGDGARLKQPSFAREVNRLSYEQHTQETNIWRLDRSTRYRMTPTPVITSTRWDSNPQLSPDGTRLAFVSHRTGSAEVWVSQSDGTNPVRLTNFDGPLVSSPRWSPDGRRLAFDARADGQADVYVIDAGGGTPRRLTDGPADDLTPSWSYDGAHLYVASNRTGPWQIWKIAVDGDTAEQVTLNGGIVAHESTDATTLYYVKPGTNGIWQQPLAGGPESLVLAHLAPADWGNWTVQSDGIYFVRRRAQGPRIEFLRFSNGLLYRIADLEALPEHPSLTVGPQGAWFLFTQVDRSESDILLVRNFE